MARKPRAEETPAHTEEQLNEDQIQALTYQHKRKYEAALGAKKKADKDLKNACKLAKSELGDGAIDNIKDLIALESEEGENKMRANVERQLRVARWAGAEFGTQFGLFEAADRTPAAERAFADGKRAGLRGDVKKPPHDPSTEQYRKWMDGFNEGQKVLVEGMAPKPPGSLGDKPSSAHLVQ